MAVKKPLAAEERKSSWRGGLSSALLLLATAFFALHYLHLQADFPNHSPWVDWAKYTDEGWYGDAAIRHFQRGSWYVPGDFNPAAALPVWPLLEAAAFRIFGVGVVPARALTVTVFGLILLCSYRLLWQWKARPMPLAPAVAVLLLATSPFCFAFMRMAVLEPLLILLMLLALLAASAVDPRATGWRRWAPPLALGLLLPAMVLTKTTAVFLLPALAWMTWARCGYSLRRLAPVALPALALALAIWGSYYAVLVRPHVLADYRYLFSANAYTGITPETAVEVIAATVRDGRWMGGALYLLGWAAALSTLLTTWRGLQRRPLQMSLLLWAGGYAAFLAYHNNLQPRYYLVPAVAVTLLVPLELERLWTAAERWKRGSGVLQGVVLLLAAVLTVSTVRGAEETLRYVRRPEYTFVHAAQAIARVIRADRSHRRLLLSISGSDLSLMTGLPSICDDFGTLELPDRVALYHPGWYVAWNQVDDDKMDALAPMYHLVRVAAFPAMDDPDRNLMILYRLDSPEHRAQQRRRRSHKPVPKRLQTKLGQQPSTTQLEH